MARAAPCSGFDAPQQKAKLIVAKLDRLSRNVSFLLKLIESGVEVLFADLPELNGAMGSSCSSLWRMSPSLRLVLSLNGPRQH